MTQGYLSSEHGEIIVANAAVVTGKVMSMTSIDGPFYVSSMIMVRLRVPPPTIRRRAMPCRRPVPPPFLELA